MKVTALLLALIGLNACSNGTVMSLDEPRHGPAFASSGYLYEGFWSRAAPELDADRRIVEQDCTRPVDYTLGNIRCK